MKKSAAILVTLTALSLVVLAQAPSPAPAPDKPQAAAEGGAKRGQAGERGRWSGGGAGGMDGQFGVDRFMGALAHGQELGKKLNLTPEQQELIKRLVLEQRSKMMEFQGKLQKAALKQTEVLMADPLDEAALMAAVEETSKVRTELAKAQIQLLLEVRKSLTEEQRKSLRELMLQMKQQPPATRQGEDRREERVNRPGKAGKPAERGTAPAAPEAAPAPAP
jgi:Spy/CpxP family protein refolding chaperone